MKHEAKYGVVLEDGRIQCRLCPKDCTLKDGQFGFCKTRTNEGGRLVTIIYAEVTGCHVDPIEKKPLYHYYPSKEILSLGTKGCNFGCVFCQNWQIAQRGSRCGTARSGSPTRTPSRSSGSSTYSTPPCWRTSMASRTCS